jgi:hypothetical protein
VLRADKLRFSRLNEIPSGHLIYVLRDTGPALALKVEHPPGAANQAVAFPAAVILCDLVRGRRMPLTDPGLGNQRCIDWGERPVVQWTHPLALPGEPVDPGYLVLTAQDLALTSHYVGGHGERLHWSLSNGAYVVPNQPASCVIAAWTLGVEGANGDFIQLAKYPDDYQAP